jgi:hypothetical protein
MGVHVLEAAPACPATTAAARSSSRPAIRLGEGASSASQSLVAVAAQAGQDRARAARPFRLATSSK